MNKMLTAIVEDDRRAVEEPGEGDTERDNMG
jgi:hypothetical protein